MVGVGPAGRVLISVLVESELAIDFLIVPILPSTTEIDFIVTSGGLIYRIPLYGDLYRANEVRLDATRRLLE